MGSVFWSSLHASMVSKARLMWGMVMDPPTMRLAFETIDACREMQKTDPELKSLL